MLVCARSVVLNDRISCEADLALGVPLDTQLGYLAGFLGKRPYFYSILIYFTFLLTPN